MEAPRSRLPILIFAGVPIAAGLAALIFVLTRPAPESIAPTAIPSTAPVASTAPNPPGAYTFASTNPIVKVTALADLPYSPDSPPPADDACDQYYGPPETSQGRIAAVRGWLIADEGELGPLTAVMIVGSFEASTSGICIAHNGNVALFDGDRLVGIAYSARGANEQIGRFEPAGEALRIGPDSPGAPLGDLTLSGHAVRFGPLPAFDSVCGGRRVPNVFGMTIANARRKLIASGWKPVPSQEEVQAFAADLRRQGVVEVVGCAGTGLGQCGFNYVAGRDRLGVGSIGDEPEFISDYSVACGAQR